MIDLPSIHWGNPYYFFLLLLIPIGLWIKKRYIQPPSILFSGIHLFHPIPNRIHKQSRVHVLFILGFILIILALSRPQTIRDHEEQQALSGIDILLLIDLSSSMLALDFTAGSELVTRLDAVQSVIQPFIQERSADRIGLVAFAGTPYLASPLTLNHEWVTKNLKRLKIGMIEDGTAIGSAIAMGAKHLKDVDSKSKIMILLTDGANTRGEITPLAAAQAAQALGIKIYTIAIGEGGIVPTLILNDQGQILLNRYGDPIIQQAEFPVDFQSLEKIASLTQATAFKATDPQSLTTIYNQINQLEKTSSYLHQPLHYQEWFWLPTLIAFFIFLYGYWIDIKNTLTQ